MKNRVSAFLFIGLALHCISQAVSAQNPLPADAKPTCTVTNAEFARWFANGMIQKDGLIVPADSLNFVPSSTCDFYKWSWQMFLWTTSPNHAYGGKGLVFDSPIFYDVTPTVKGKRNFVANPGLGLKTFGQFRSQINHKGKFVRIKDGKLVESEEGQATGDVLMAQTGSLVYYGIHVNDVYAYFLTGNKDGEITPKQTTFPANTAQLKFVTDFAGKHKKTLPDANALVVELKTSWVEVDKLPNADQYIQITGLVPTYEKAASKWTATGKTHEVKLALVGMHVVGTVKGHPEMIWATFEHVNNAPNANYNYINNKNATITVKENTAGTWLFCKSKAAAPFNVPHMHVMGNDIAAYPMQTISASNSDRHDPWGQGTAANNTQIISLNNSVLSKIVQGDLRKNYVLIGSTWTTGVVPGMTPNPAQTVGSQELANATMETYIQPSNCFDCHSGSKNNGLGSAGGGGLSHIYGDLQGLKF